MARPGLNQNSRKIPIREIQSTSGEIKGGAIKKIPMNDSKLFKRAKLIAREHSFSPESVITVLNEYEDIIHGKTIKISISDKTNDTLHLQVKVPPQGDAKYNRISSRNRFRNEALFYAELSPLLQDYGSIPTIPRFYGCSLEHYDEMLFIQDLEKEGYSKVDFASGMDEAHIKLVIAALARLWSAGYTWKMRNESDYKSLVERLGETCFEPGNEEAESFNEMLYKSALDFLIAEEGFDDFMSNRLIRIKKRLKKILHSCAQNNVAEPWVTVVNGGLSRNGLLFKYHKGQPIDAAFVDWGSTRICTPIADLSEFLFTCADITSLGQLKTYFEQYQSLMVPRMTLFLDHLLEFGKYGVLRALGHLVLDGTKHTASLRDLNEFSLLKSPDFKPVNFPDLTKTLVQIIKQAFIMKLI